MRAIEEAPRTLRVKAEIENPEGRLRPGLFARADLRYIFDTPVLQQAVMAVDMAGDDASQPVGAVQNQAGAGGMMPPTMVIAGVLGVLVLIGGLVYRRRNRLG